MSLFDERFGAGTGAILLDNVNCQGNETSIVDCQHAPWGQHNCRHHEDVSVVCVDSLDITGNQLYIFMALFVDSHRSLSCISYDYTSQMRVSTVTCLVFIWSTSISYIEDRA